MATWNNGETRHPNESALNVVTPTSLQRRSLLTIPDLLGANASELTRCRPAKRDQVFTDRFSTDVVANRIEVGSVGILAS